MREILLNCCKCPKNVKKNGNPAIINKTYMLVVKRVDIDFYWFYENCNGSNVQNAKWINAGKNSNKNSKNSEAENREKVKTPTIT